MVDAPRQNWQLVDARSRDEDAEWLRGLSTQDRFALYEDMLTLFAAARPAPSELERLDRWCWEEKLAIRRKLLNAYSKLDQLHRERAAANHSG
jgi:hypothetical protein